MFNVYSIDNHAYKCDTLSELAGTSDILTSNKTIVRQYSLMSISTCGPLLHLKHVKDNSSEFVVLLFVICNLSVLVEITLQIARVFLYS